MTFTILYNAVPRYFLLRRKSLAQNMFVETSAAEVCFHCAVSCFGVYDLRAHETFDKINLCKTLATFSSACSAGVVFCPRCDNAFSFFCGRHSICKFGRYFEQLQGIHRTYWLIFDAMFLRGKKLGAGPKSF